MSEEIVVRCASPTLAGLKTGSLFSCPMESREQAMRDIRDMNRSLIRKGVSILPLRFDTGRVLIYLFRPGFLKRDLEEKETIRILEEKGYRQLDFGHCLARLIRRLNSQDEFPHEIGLFLSYPPEDVRGFIENRAANCKCVGCWKVYGDEQAAKKRFAVYEKCTRDYCRQWASGKSLSQLAVNV